MTTPTPFVLPWTNTDIDIHPEPAEGWHRVAVVSGWHDAAKARKRWPHAAVVGPLRSLRGIDLLVRALLANPQIRVLVWDGPDLNGGKVKDALYALWYGLEGSELADDIEPHAQVLRDAMMFIADTEEAVRFTGALDENGWPSRVDDRPGVAVILPPPPPTVSDTRAAHVTAPRFEGDTLADLWPQVLGEILRAGRQINTHYGETLEVLNMVGVIRDPAGSLAEVGGWPPPECGLAGIVPVAQDEPHPVLGFSWADLDSYYAKTFEPGVGEGMAYSYGSLLCGESWWEACDDRDREAQCKTCKALIARVEGWRSSCAFCGATTPDQLAALDAGLADNPLYRGHFATPWHPSKFASAAAKGKPCMVGLQLRAVPTWPCGTVIDHCTACGTEHDGTPSNAVCPACGQDTLITTWGSEQAERFRTGERYDDASVLGQRDIDGTHYALHATVTFRSHSMFDAHPQNLAAVCLYLCRLAEKHGMDVGTVTCLSVSAHLYDRDWDAARAVVEAYKAPVLEWDGRSSWAVEKTGGNDYGDLIDTVRAGGEYVPPSDGLRATATDPTGENILGVFEGRNPENLARACVDSGLLTTTGAAVWLGREIERVWRSR